jgi:DNA-binding FadR family transcriptional regulator
MRQTVKRMSPTSTISASVEDSDRDFHLRLAKASGNGSLELVVEGLWAQRAELWGRMQKHFHTPELAQQTIRDHAAIVKAIAAHDALGSARRDAAPHRARGAGIRAGLEGTAQAQKATRPSSAQRGRRTMLPTA